MDEATQLRQQINNRYGPEMEALRNRIPPLIMAGLDRYIEGHIETGGFLRAVLENDLKEAFIRADLHSRAALFDIVSYLYNYAPMTCWGSEDQVANWLKMRFKKAETGS
jgi:hypothetical protein